MSTPPHPASGAEIDTFTITNTEVDRSNRVFAEVDQFANKDNANDITYQRGTPLCRTQPPGRRGLCHHGHGGRAAARLAGAS